MTGFFRGTFDFENSHIDPLMSNNNRFGPFDNHVPLHANESVTFVKDNETITSIPVISDATFGVSAGIVLDVSPLPSNYYLSTGLKPYHLLRDLPKDVLLNHKVLHDSFEIHPRPGLQGTFVVYYDLEVDPGRNFKSTIRIVLIHL